MITQPGCNHFCSILEDHDVKGSPLLPLVLYWVPDQAVAPQGDTIHSSSCSYGYSGSWYSGAFGNTFFTLTAPSQWSETASFPGLRREAYSLHRTSHKDPIKDRMARRHRLSPRPLQLNLQGAPSQHGATWDSRLPCWVLNAQVWDTDLLPSALSTWQEAASRAPLSAQAVGIHPNPTDLLKLRPNSSSSQSPGVFSSLLPTLETITFISTAILYTEALFSGTAVLSRVCKHDSPWPRSVKSWRHLSKSCCASSFGFPLTYLGTVSHSCRNPRGLCQGTAFNAECSLKRNTGHHWDKPWVLEKKKCK